MRRSCFFVATVTCVLATAGALFVPRAVSASEIYSSARTIGEGYMVRVPGPEGTFVTRRRLVQYVSLGVYDILPPKDPTAYTRDPAHGQLTINTSMRLRHDFGTYTRFAEGDAEALLGSLDGRQVDILYGYLRGDSLAGWLDFQLGRQFEMSGLDWYAFDGGWFRLRSPLHVALEAFGGFDIDGAAAFGYSKYERDGTALDFSEDKHSPMFGVALTTDELAVLDARVAYRRIFSPAALNRDVVSDSTGEPVESAVDSEVVSATAALRLADGRFFPHGAVRFNLGTARLDDVTAGADWRISERHLVRASYLRTIPAFDLDSAFNVFVMTPFEDARLGLQVHASPSWILHTRAQIRFFRSEETSRGTEPETGVGLGYGGAVGARYAARRFTARLDAHALDGEGGLQTGGAAHAWFRPDRGRTAFEAGIYGMYYDDESVVDRNGFSTTVQAGANIQMWRGLSLHVVGEEMLTSFVKNAFRALAILSVDWSLRVGER